MSDQWDLRHFYGDEKAFEADLQRFRESLTPKMVALQGHLGEEKAFGEYLQLEREIEKCATRLELYAGSASDLNKKDVVAATRLSKVELALQDFQEKTSWADPEILALGEKKVQAFFHLHPEFAEFDYAFSKLFLAASHVLSADKEQLLSAYSGLGEEGSKLYSMLSVADYSAKSCTLSDGREVQVSQSSWTRLIEESKSDEDRAKVFETLYQYFDEHKNTYGEIYNTVLQSELAEKKTRGYASILESHLFANKIPTSVFTNLIHVASANAEPLRKYYQIRARYLGLTKHRSYDRFIQLAHSDKKYSYDEAKTLFWDSIKSFPEDFQNKAHAVLEEGYVDVYPHEGKRSGAYSNGGFQDGKEKIHPIILFNFEGQLDDCFTLAHESGHSIHTFYAMESQPLMKQNYTIFTAEIASTFNEHNLLDYLLSQPQLDKATKICLLQKAIDEIMGTFYRQTLFAQYEYEISLLAEQGEPINYQVLSDKMVALYQLYYGIDITEEKVKPLVWAYIPHLFYTPFYVYQYATSFTASMLLYENVKAHKPHAFENYLGLLKSGGSAFPIEEVRSAGVDLTGEDAFLAVTHRMKELVDELERTLFA